MEKGEKLMTISSEYGISKQQISDICKNKDKIMKFADNLESNHALKRKSLKVTHDVDSWMKPYTHGSYSKEQLAH